MLPRCLVVTLTTRTWWSVRWAAYKQCKKSFIFKTSIHISFQISRESIDACKDWFRDDLQKSDWALMVELKKLFEILWSCVIFTWSKTSWSEQWKINSIVKKLQLPIMCIALFARIYNEIRSFLTIVIFWATGIGLVTGISFNLWIGQVQIRSAR